MNAKALLLRRCVHRPYGLDLLTIVITDHHHKFPPTHDNGGYHQIVIICIVHKLATVSSP